MTILMPILIASLLPCDSYPRPLLLLHWLLLMVGLQTLPPTPAHAPPYPLLSVFV